MARNAIAIPIPTVAGDLYRWPAQPIRKPSTIRATNGVGEVSSTGASLDSTS